MCCNILEIRLCSKSTPASTCAVHALSVGCPQEMCFTVYLRVFYDEVMIVCTSF